MPAIGNVAITVAMSLDGTSDNGEIATLTPRMFIRPGGAAIAVVPLRQVPNLPDGNYRIVAHVTDPLSHESSVTSADIVNITAPRVALSISVGPVIPGTIRLGRRGVVVVTLANSGNVDSVGPANLKVGWSSDGVNVAATVLDLTLPIVRIRAGGHLVLHLPLLAVTTLSPRAYFVTAAISQNGNATSAVSGGVVELN
jgi:hypothetical protein